MRSLQFCVQAVLGLCAMQFSCTEEGWGLCGSSMWTVLARSFVLVIVVHALFLVHDTACPWAFSVLFVALVLALVQIFGYVQIFWFCCCQHFLTCKPVLCKLKKLIC